MPVVKRIRRLDTFDSHDVKHAKHGVVRAGPQVSAINSKQLRFECILIDMVRLLVTDDTSNPIHNFGERFACVFELDLV